MSFPPVTDPSPLRAPAAQTVLDTSIHTGTACLALMDLAAAADVWEDLLFDGHGHQHAGGGLMLNGAALGTHFDYDGDFPVRLNADGEGRVLALQVNLDPYGDDLEHGHGHDEAPHGGHEPIPDGWSEPVTVPLTSDRAVLGDPAGLPEADDVGGLLDVQWPACR
jgi:hypothetical protein